MSQLLIFLTFLKFFWQVIITRIKFIFDRLNSENCMQALSV